jgi:hypothetical protein
MECELGKLLPTLNEKVFCQRLIGSVNVAMAHCINVDEVSERHKELGILMIDRHSNVGSGPEELSRKWNIGLQMAKDTLEVTESFGGVQNWFVV